MDVILKCSEYAHAMVVIVRRVVEARRIHYLQQFPQSTQPSSSHGRPPVVERTTSQLIAHSHTPPLTAHERALSDAVYQMDGSAENQRQWFGIKRALSKKIAKIRKNSDTPAPKSDTAAKQAEPSAGKTSKAHKRKSSVARNNSIARSHEAPHETSQNEAPLTQGNTVPARQRNDNEISKEGWWKRLNCSRA